MEMPELYGSPYILPAIIVVVLLLLVVLVLSKRKRRTAAPAATRSVARQPVSAPAAAADTVAVTGPTGLRRGAAPLDDPLRSVIMDILQGWGELTGDDTKRLEVFRPEKILEEAEKVILPKDHKAGEHARVRLAGIRHYAAELQLKAKPADPDPGPTTEAHLDATASEATEAAEPAEEAAPLEAVDAAVATPMVESSDVSSWVDELEGWEVSEPQPPEEIPARPDEEAPAMETQPEDLWETETLTAREGTPEDSLSSLHMKIKTANDLLALPADQRVDMLVFLGPAQLSQVFEATDDLDLKMGVIDTLERVGNPSALDVLRRCLDDPSPEVQLRALGAADRLLGVD